MSPLFRIIQGLATNEVNHPGYALGGRMNMRAGTLLQTWVLSGLPSASSAGYAMVSSGERPVRWYCIGILWAIASYFFKRSVCRNSGCPTKMKGKREQESIWWLMTKRSSVSMDGLISWASSATIMSGFGHCACRDSNDSDQIRLLGGLTIAQILTGSDHKLISWPM